MEKHKESQQDMNKIADELPDEDGSIMVEGHLKIFDPETGEVFLGKRT